MTAARREAAVLFISLGISVVRACFALGLSRSQYYRTPTDWRIKDAAVIDALNEQLEKAPRSGFWKCYRRIRLKGYGFNHKRVYRVYCRLGLNLPRRVKRVLPSRIRRPLEVKVAVNHQWALDFMHDGLYCGRRFRTLNVIDEGTRECLAIEVDTSLPSGRVIRVLERLRAERGLPSQLRVDNGPELISGEFVEWCELHGVELLHIQPGKPQQNGFVERFNGSFRREFLDAYLFESLSQVREMSWSWMLDYNEARPHESLGYLPPAVYRQQIENST